MVQRISCLVIVLTAIAALGCNSSRQPATEERSVARSAAVNASRLAAADAEPGQWMSHGRTYGEQRFSPLDQISTETVGKLGLSWSADLDTRRGQEATPLVADGGRGQRRTLRRGHPPVVPLVGLDGQVRRNHRNPSPFRTSAFTASKSARKSGFFSI